MKQEPKCKSELSVECIKKDIMMDIYYYEKALTSHNLRNESKEYYQNKLKECEELFKTL